MQCDVYAVELFTYQTNPNIVKYARAVKIKKFFQMKGFSSNQFFSFHIPFKGVLRQKKIGYPILILVNYNYDISKRCSRFLNISSRSRDI